MGEVRYASEVAYAVKFLVSLKVKFYFRKIKDRFLAFTFAVAKIPSCVSRISSAKWISLAFMRISLHASALAGALGKGHKDKKLKRSVISTKRSAWRNLVLPLNEIEMFLSF